ncbi:MULTISPECIES: DUF554 domain-containing protein [unclassified Paenibacillus]|uniref:DUF554 domain-containing protein n=1 Tax=unclassified Paenibacillus TaxID=185978 RepID=UPI001AE234A5|nr:MULTISPECIES: DUF554 domain-containing protein [unclassified Paenibacillus]MBP1153723.1 putative membrane protein YqgA involved in biofilm formation [Paenibacillus sp. PvP091]MBP1170892.1 putative membrane protein YqgA involved in biofilm formation [Paenibacillus sp. PvR098]MBP2441920.1 putative membrane protein YqgA involved in biofilm formation [Paenibacillus sp. PvP052]
MALWGTIINALAIIAGGLLGSLVLPRISEGIRNTVMQGLGISIAVLGITMALKSENFLIVIISIVVGGIIGEVMRIEYRLNQLGLWVEKQFHREEKADPNTGSIAEGFVTATLIYCIGAMAILGSIDSGLRHNHDILYTKSILDGISAVILSSTLGIGVTLSAAPVFLYQGTIALTATLFTLFISDADLSAIITEVTAVGGVLIIGIGLNILHIKKINVANLLPSIFIAAVIVLGELSLR